MEDDAQDWLEELAARIGAVAGSVHRQVGEDLVLVAALRLPPPVLAAVQHVPRGKGMAGQAQVQKKPVLTCNLQKEEATVRPGARAVQAQAGIALPVFDRAGEVRAVVGLAWPDERPLDEGQLLEAVAGLS